MKALKIVLIVLVVLIALPWVIVIIAAPFNARTASETDLSKSQLLAAPPPPLSKPLTLKIVTFNIHDMYVISWDRPERMRGIGKVLTNLDPDLVGFQEAWIEADRQVLLESVAGSRLAYSQYYPAGTAGSGKFILSAYPIREAFFHRYVRNGKWYKPYHGDWWGGKGVGLARVELPGNAGFIDFYDTHAHAGYGSNEYDADREAQMRELAEFVKTSSLKTAPAFVAGDFNTHKGREAYRILSEDSNLERLMNIDTSIDHIFGAKNPLYKFEVVETVPIDVTIPVAGGNTSLSDHTGYMSTIRIVHQQPAAKQ